LVSLDAFLIWHQATPYSFTLILINNVGNSKKTVLVHVHLFLFSNHASGALVSLSRLAKFA
jgi:hypothetical protein